KLTTGTRSPKYSPRRSARNHRRPGTPSTPCTDFPRDDARTPTPMTTTYAPGSLVSARGREWVVLPESATDMLVLRPLGGSDDDVAALFPALEKVSTATFDAPDPTDLGNAEAAGLLRSALRIGF